MKSRNFRILSVLALGVAAAASIPAGQSQAAAATSLIFNTSFDCTEWSQLSWTDPCQAGDPINSYGGWTTSSGKGDEITVAANDPLGVGRGFRHWRGNGQNNNGGGVKISFAPSSEVWIRWYMRYSAGFAWTNGQPGYTKDLYIHPGESGAIISGFSGGKFYVHTTNGSIGYHSSTTWSTINGGSLGDGKFHAYEIHLKLGSSGSADMWVDGLKVGSYTGINWGRTSISEMVVGENQWDVINGDHYTDYDDIAVSQTGYIGPIGGTPPLSAPLAPTNLRILR